MEKPGFVQPEPVAEKRNEKAHELARTMFGIAEDVGDIIDVKLRALMEKGPLKPFEISDAAGEARRLVFFRACKALNIDEGVQSSVLDGE